ncbi:uncharacterized protein BYT42DRAFT_23285 [Radiomyces spectabilis]|uniref:uncharacterized protein n=1 Tax=Radiomyces spectabilis TaxID=64574 RepID=UPI0022209680|nr:uncharacterized protein BYT42DRAFT_23285 [Radiomyces spectabilis]KAI8393903.1 hypothetical protein BYT42DRAFT_23285 [Radiomyces spectabilis]
MRQVLNRMERKVFIQEQDPQTFVSSAYVSRNVHDIFKGKNLPKRVVSSMNVAVRDAIRNKTHLRIPFKCKPTASDEYKRLMKFVEATKTAIQEECFKPLKYTDPKGCRRYSLLPVYSFQKRHIALDAQSFSKLLCSSGITKRTFHKQRSCTVRVFSLF